MNFQYIIQYYEEINRIVLHLFHFYCHSIAIIGISYEYVCTYVMMDELRNTSQKQLEGTTATAIIITTKMLYEYIQLLTLYKVFWLSQALNNYHHTTVSS